MLQRSRSSTEDGYASEDSLEIMNQFLGSRDSQHKSSNLVDGRNELPRSSNIEWIPQHSLDHSQVSYKTASSRMGSGVFLNQISELYALDNERYYL